jgi:beta-N-acetylhexosaminidase
MAPGAAILAPLGAALTPDEAAFFRDADPWGFILFQRNAESPDQLRRLTAALRDAVGRDAPILIDQEGGRVQRLWPPHFRAFRPPLDDAALGPRAFWLRGRLIAHELTAVGIDVNCAPSADVAAPETHPFLRNRCYGADVDTVVRNARAMADGLLDGGCLPVLKHAPGHGRARVDSHKDLPVITARLEDLHDRDFPPFEALADLPLVMTAHLLIPSIDPETPVTLSRSGITFLREELGLTGLIMSDDLSMQALPGDIASRATRAIAAGCDVALHCNGRMDEMVAVMTGLGRMTPDAAARAETALAAKREVRDIDPSELDDELQRLIDGGPHA